LNLSEAFHLYSIAIVLLCIGTIASFFIIKAIILKTGKGTSLLRPSKFNNFFDRILSIKIRGDKK